MATCRSGCEGLVGGLKSEKSTLTFQLSLSMMSHYIFSLDPHDLTTKIYRQRAQARDQLLAKATLADACQVLSRIRTQPQKMYLCGGKFVRGGCWMATVIRLQCMISDLGKRDVSMREHLIGRNQKRPYADVPSSVFCQVLFKIRRATIIPNLLVSTCLRNLKRGSRTRYQGNHLGVWGCIVLWGLQSRVPQRKVEEKQQA
jgi:hypothetical protein